MAVHAGIYTRISQDRDGTGLATDRQEKDCRNKAAQMGWTVAEVYTDQDVSATSKKARPAYERMMADLRSGKINAVVVWDVDRLTRHPMELEDFILLVEQLQVRLANVSGDIDLSTDGGQLMARMKGALARMEAQKMGARLKRQKLQRAESGAPPAGGRHKTFGYTRDWKVIDSEADIIRDAFRRTLLGESTQSIADHWTSIGVNMGNGKAVYFSTVNNVLKRKLYAGRTVHNGIDVGPSQVPPIIDLATFEAAQAAMASRDNSGPRGKNARRYLLSGIVTCGECLFSLGGGPTGKDRHGVSRHKYACRKAIGGCGKVSVAGPSLERMVLYVVRQSLIVGGNPHKADVIDYGPQIDAVEAKIKDVQQLVTSNQLEPMDAAPMISGFAKERARIMRLDAAQVKEVAEGQAFADWDEFTAAGISEQKAHVNRVVERIFINSSNGKTAFDPNRIKIHMRKSGNIVTGETIWKASQGINPYMVVDGFRKGY